ncbi:MAG TPA: DUF924 family protein [Steroidobacteraceae bacterium]|nr:DUF924 family protein [Steroidobacteraceae bacterium]
MSDPAAESAAVLRFWFGESGSEAWWKPDPAFDATIRRRFAAVYERAILGELFAWRAKPEGRLAEIIVLDQFSRNLFRDSARAYAQDLAALALAQEAVAAKAHLSLEPVQRAFLLLPYMHSESREIHAVAEKLFREFAPPENHDFELRHKAIVDRFGRYPHRNEVLGRASTAEELEFLGQPGSSF